MNKAKRPAQRVLIKRYLWPAQRPLIKKYLWYLSEELVPIKYCRGLNTTMVKKQFQLLNWLTRVSNHVAPTFNTATIKDEEQKQLLYQMDEDFKNTYKQTPKKWLKDPIQCT